MSIPSEASEQLLNRLRRQSQEDSLRITQHAHQEMVEEGILLTRFCRPLPLPRYLKIIRSTEGALVAY